MQLDPNPAAHLFSIPKTTEQVDQTRTARAVSEKDFRLPEFKDAVVDDYEFRSDGKLVRRDRWERVVQSIRAILGINPKSFELDDVVESVRRNVQPQETWNDAATNPVEVDGPPIDIQLIDGSTLRAAEITATGDNWASMRNIGVRKYIIKWRVSPKK